MNGGLSMYYRQRIGFYVNDTLSRVHRSNSKCCERLDIFPSRNWPKWLHVSLASSDAPRLGSKVKIGLPHLRATKSPPTSTPAPPENPRPWQHAGLASNAKKAPGKMAMSVRLSQT